ncbi:hypothetical protein FRC96_05195 [Lujinxingia vulgaris]|uniref:VCBS repeat-containing protein n=1 Tax=Lujinxingia vulgaris TaxID=2600176 RepID=A0A5C6XK55_9DELT|nr:FG-GAP-like repeat-containing protein [Lujinxingia vulgaris]TXD40839.1 hypothetical protein FRC96_05195 [Lujinxingia vulgaris]
MRKLKCSQGVWWALVVMVVLGAGCGDSAEELEELDAGADVLDGGEDADAEDVGGRDVEPCLDGEEQACDLSESCQGIQVCVEGEWTACEVPEESCDGVDNDCDGEIDEDFAGLGEVCVSGEGQCQVSGELICGDDGLSVTCSVEAGPGVEEVCDGVDNDCDGEVDNVAALGESCSVGTGQCAASGVQVCDVEARALVCDAVGAEPSVEICDGLDNDCDGEVDNVVGLGEGCSVGTGQCVASGVQVCDMETGGLVCDASAGSPQVETCNGLDDDCDGEVDNVAGLGESCSVGTGQCAASGTRVCNLGAGTLVCNATPGSPQAETCNGVDDNCDGTPDNVAGLGNSCSVGVGACRRTGNRICDLGSESLTCSASPGTPSAETCNGVDDNCDGTIDNTSVSFGSAASYGADRGCIAMAAGDINGDGRVDVVCAPVLNSVTSPDTRLFAYVNQGGGSFSAARYLQAVAVSPFRAQSGLELGDVDGDGDLDIVAVGETMKAQVYINTGSGQFAAPYEAFQYSPGGEPGTSGLVLADMDGDGDLDIVTTIGTIRSSTWQLALSRNNGNGSFGAPTIIDATAPSARALRSVDVDGDGDRDLIAVNASEVLLYRASSPGVFAAPSAVVSGTAALGHDPVLADVTNDGRADLLLPASGMRYFVPGTASGFGSAQSTSVQATEMSAAVGQFDCDGAAEVMIVAANGGAPLYYLATPPNLSSQRAAEGQNGNAVRVFDVDNDGDDDVVIGSLDNGIRVLRRQ